MSIQSLSEPILPPGVDERDYLLKRAEDHRQLAQKSQEVEPRSIHLRLQQLYADQAATIPIVDID